MSIIEIIKPVRECTECGKKGNTQALAWCNEWMARKGGLERGKYLVHRHHVCEKCFRDAVLRTMPREFQIFWQKHFGPIEP